MAQQQTTPPSFIIAEGYQCPPSIKCQVCSQPWEDPTELIPCGHIFCKVCVEKSGGGWSCPDCFQTVDDKVPAHSLIQNMVDRVLVQCTGCSWRGSKKASKAHRCPPPKQAENVRIVEQQQLKQHPEAFGGDDGAANTPAVGAPVMGTVIGGAPFMSGTGGSGGITSTAYGGLPSIQPLGVTTTTTNFGAGVGGDLYGNNYSSNPYSGISVPPTTFSTTPSIQTGSVVVSETSDEKKKQGMEIGPNEATSSLKTSVAVNRSASDKSVKRPWFEYNLSKKEYDGILDSFFKAARSTSISIARVGKNSIGQILEENGLELKKGAAQEIDALCSLYNDSDSLMAPTVSLEEFLTWLRYGPATKISSQKRTLEARKWAAWEDSEEEKAAKRVGNFVHDEMQAPSADSLASDFALPSTAALGCAGVPPPISDFSIGSSGGIGGAPAVGDLLSAYSLGDNK